MHVITHACAEGREGDFLSRSLFPLAAFLSLSPRTLFLSLLVTEVVFVARNSPLLLLNSSFFYMFLSLPLALSLAIEIPSRGEAGGKASLSSSSPLPRFSLSLSLSLSSSLSRDIFPLLSPRVSSRQKLLPSREEAGGGKSSSLPSVSPLSLSFSLLVFPLSPSLSSVGNFSVASSLSPSSLSFLSLSRSDPRVHWTDFDWILKERCIRSTTRNAPD